MSRYPRACPRNFALLLESYYFCQSKARHHPRPKTKKPCSYKQGLSLGKKEDSSTCAFWVSGAIRAYGILKNEFAGCRRAFHPSHKARFCLIFSVRTVLKDPLNFCSSLPNALVRRSWKFRLLPHLRPSYGKEYVLIKSQKVNHHFSGETWKGFTVP